LNEHNATDDSNGMNTYTENTMILSVMVFESYHGIKVYE